MQPHGVAGYSGSARRVLHFRSAGGRNDADSECHNDANRYPNGGHVDKVGRDREADDDDDEANDVSGE